MGFLDKAKAAAEQAATKAKEGVQDVQTKRELGQAYTELGQKTYELADSGALAHPELTPLIEKVRALEAQDEAEPQPAAAATVSSEPPPSDQPPAMPS
ncbi:MAG: hypothetical protein E6G22_15740 [Actinobacteria bacterium]|nr:MAG: hypothetical protein E6G22_15740 [Actinomycetota bacterium]